MSYKNFEYFGHSINPVHMLYSAYSSECDCEECYMYELPPPLPPMGIPADFGFPFCPGLQQPAIYYAHYDPNNSFREGKKRNRNVFSKAFKWYTQDRASHQRPDKEDQPQPGPDIDGFAAWLDSKYHQFQDERTSGQPPYQHNGMRPSWEEANLPYYTKHPRKRGRSARNMNEGGDIHMKTSTSFQFILKPKELDRTASECCYQPCGVCCHKSSTLASSDSDKKHLRSQSDTTNFKECSPMPEDKTYSEGSPKLPEGKSGSKKNTSKQKLSKVKCQCSGIQEKLDPGKRNYMCPTNEVAHEKTLTYNKTENDTVPTPTNNKTGNDAVQTLTNNKTGNDAVQHLQDALLQGDTNTTSQTINNDPQNSKDAKFVQNCIADESENCRCINKIAARDENLNTNTENFQSPVKTSEPEEVSTKPENNVPVCQCKKIIVLKSSKHCQTGNVCLAIASSCVPSRDFKKPPVDNEIDMQEDVAPKIIPAYSGPLQPPGAPCPGSCGSAGGVTRSPEPPAAPPPPPACVATQTRDAPLCATKRDGHAQTSNYSIDLNNVTFTNTTTTEPFFLKILCPYRQSNEISA